MSSKSPERSPPPSSRGRVLVVTGGGRGIGAAVARLASQRGYAVCVNYLQGWEDAAELVEAIRRDGKKAIAVQADVASESDVQRLFETTTHELGPITALVNNAGTLEPQTRFDAVTYDRLHRLFMTNVIGQMLCAREAIRRMSSRHGGAGGAIVNVSSIAALSGSPAEYVDYAATKGAIDTFTVGLAREVADEGVRVNGVRPGFIYTDLHAKGGEPDRVDRLKTSVPMQRGGQPQEVAEAILWLLSDEASFVTGSMLDVTGGR